MEYQERGIPNYGDPFYNTNVPTYRLNYAYQYWNPSRSDAFPYTSLFIDLMDDHNQRGRFNGAAITDDVKGYSLALIESSFLKHTYGLSTLRKNLKNNRPIGVSDAQIDQLLDQIAL